MIENDFLPTGWLAQTKLHPPRPRADLIVRERLLSLLGETVLSCRLTLLSAPAGYGKTTLMTLLSQTMPTLPLAWLSLDQEDNDPVSFFSGLIAALQRLNPACGQTAQTVLIDTTNPPVDLKRVMAVLINEILETLPTPFLVVLDDLQVISEPAIHQALDYLLERLPPQVHLLVGTRSDPPLALARLRARGELIELHPDALRFTLEETTTLLNDQLRLGLSAADLTTLYEHTEGWAAGLRLVAGSLQPRLPFSERTDFVTYLARSNRHIFDLLAEEVLQQQRPEVQTFLLETSILSELTPSLCRAVTGRSDADTLLEALYQQHLFLSALDERPADQPDQLGVGRSGSTLLTPTYRYHELFAEFLRQQLTRTMPHRLPELHRRAAAAQTHSGRAIRHYLAGELWTEAAQAISQVGDQLLQQGWLASLQNWIAALPPSIVLTEPRLSYLCGVCAWHQRRLTEAAFHLENALTGFEQAGTQIDQGQTLAYLSDLAYFKADFGQGAALIERALACPIKAYTRIQLLITRARLAFFQGKFISGDQDVEAVLQITQQAGDADSYYALLEGFILGFAGMPGRLARLDQLYHLAAQLIDNHPMLQVALAEQRLVFHTFRGEITQALQVGLQAQALGERLGGRPPRQFWTLHSFLMNVLLLCGQRRDAELIIDRLLSQEDDLHPLAKAGFYFGLGRICWSVGRPDDTRRAFRQMEQLGVPITGPIAKLARGMFDGLMLLLAGDNEAARQALIAAVRLESEIPIFNPFGCARIWLAYLDLQMGLTTEALAETTAALAEVARQGTAGRILMEARAAIPVLRLAVTHDRHSALARRLLAILETGLTTEPQPVTVPDTGETLSVRELEVLQLIADGANNQTIAEALTLSVHTVKRHVANIFSKLNVSSRTQAAARARELRLLD